MSYNKLRKGFSIFQKDYYQSDKNKLYQNLAKKGQKPETLVIACSDSRIDPAILTHSAPGEFFAIRNIAALVPPYKTDDQHHGTSSAIEYAVRHLKVKHIVVLGHEKCGGVNALATPSAKSENNNDFEFLDNWLGIALDAKNKVDAELPHAEDTEKIRALEQATILTSLANLLSFPWIEERCRQNKLRIHGWYFDISKGQLLEYDPEESIFRDISESDLNSPLLDQTLCINNFLQTYVKNCSCAA